MQQNENFEIFMIAAKFQVCIWNYSRFHGESDWL